MSEGTDDLFWIGQNGDGVGLKAGAGSLPGFELAIEDNGGKGEFLFWEALAGAHLPWAQDEVIGLNGADRVAILGEVELDGCRGNWL